jgi:hypothetical protein
MATPQATIFISYRRADSASDTGRIYDRLVERYGRAHIFKDVDSIPPGADFPEYIAASIQASDVALVVIGPQWLSVSAGFAQRRLDDPADFVRVEIETALRLGVAVIPVLVGGATLPPARRLPESLRPLLRQNGLAVRQDPDFARDLERVFAAVDYWQGQPRRPAPPPAPIAPAPTATSPAPMPAPRMPAAAAARAARQSASATAIAERIGLAGLRQRRLTRRLAPMAALVSALVVIAASAGLLFNGTALRLFNPPNIAATKTAGAQATAQAHIGYMTHATETALAKLLVQTYAPTPGPGPCDKQDPQYSAQQQSYWFWSPSSAVVCASDTKTAELTLTPPSYNTELTFNGYPTSPGFPAAFTASITISFSASTSNGASSTTCASYTAYFPAQPQTAQTIGVTLCRDGSWYPANNNGQAPHYIAVSATYRLAIAVTSSSVAISVNGQQLLGPISVIGGVDAASIQFYHFYGAASDSIGVSDFVIQPT